MHRLEARERRAAAERGQGEGGVEAWSDDVMNVYNAAPAAATGEGSSGAAAAWCAPCAGAMEGADDVTNMYNTVSERDAELARLTEEYVQTFGRGDAEARDTDYPEVLARFRAADAPTTGRMGSGMRGAGHAERAEADGRGQGMRWAEERRPGKGRAREVSDAMMECEVCNAMQGDVLPRGGCADPECLRARAASGTAT